MVLLKLRIHQLKVKTIMGVHNVPLAIILTCTSILLLIQGLYLFFKEIELTDKKVYVYAGFSFMNILGAALIMTAAMSFW